MNVIDEEITRFIEVAIEISKIEDPAVRRKEGMWLNQQLVNFDDTHPNLSYDQRVEFMVAIRVLIEVTLAADPKEALKSV